MRENNKNKLQENQEVLVRMENITKHFGAVVALKDVDFTVGKQEIVGLVGDNGAGKSTLIKILVGVYFPTEGRILLDGHEVNLTSSKDAKEQGIQAVYQELALANNINVMQNIFLGREIFKRGMGKIMKVLDKKKMIKESRELLTNLGIKIHSVRTKVGLLSGGERQAVAICKAIYGNPRLMIMDEPTAAISVKETERTLELILQLKSEGTSVIFISHTLPEIFHVSDRIVTLRRGRKVGDKIASETSIEETIKLMVG